MLQEANTREPAPDRLRRRDCKGYGLLCHTLVLPLLLREEAVNSMDDHEEGLPDVQSDNVNAGL